MLILEIKSAFDWPLLPSRTFAPMLVPLRKICLDITNSFFSAQKYLYILTILKANALLFFTIKFSISII